MKEELELHDIDLEQLLRSKTWNQLSETERKAALEIISGEEEYDRLYAMVHQLKTTTGVHDADVIPSGNIRENLLMAFDDEQRRKRVLWWSVMGFWLRDKLRLDVPAMRLGLAAVVLAAGFFALWQVTSGEKPATGIAETKKSPEVPSDDDVAGKPNKLEKENLRVIGDSSPYPMFIQPQEMMVEEHDDNDDEVIGVENNFREPEGVVQAPQLNQPDSAGRIIVQGNDSVAVYLPTIDAMPGNVDAVCCGGTQPFTMNASSQYSWSPTGTNVTPTFDVNVTNANVASIQLTPPNCRSLANDRNVIAAFFSLK